LQIKNNHIKDEGVEYLATMLQINKVVLCV